MTPRAPTIRRLRGAWRAPLALLLTYALGMLLLVLSGFVDYRNANDTELSAGNVARTLQAMEKLRQIGNTFYVAETSQRGYIITGNPADLESYRDMQQRIPARLQEVRALVSDTPVQRASIDAMRTLAASKFAEMDKTLQTYQSSGQASAIAVVGNEEARNTMSSVRKLIRGMHDEESRILVEHRADAATIYSGGLVRALATTALVAIALTAFYLLMQRYLRQRDAALEVVEASNAELEQRVIDRTADLSDLSRHLLDVREHEKKIIARDLHDDFGSYLTAINMDVSRVRDKIASTNPEQAAKLERTLALLGSAIEMKRQLISDLRPSLLDNLGLAAALEQYIDQWSRRTGITATFDHEGDLDNSDDGCPIAIFRVFQEALTNVAKHSRATRVAAHIYRADDTIEFEIADDGIGISAADRAKTGIHGLLGIRERVFAYHGSFEVVGGAQGGSVLRARLPCRASAGAGPTPQTMQFA